MLWCKIKKSTSTDCLETGSNIITLFFFNIQRAFTNPIDSRGLASSIPLSDCLLLVGRCNLVATLILYSWYSHTGFIATQHSMDIFHKISAHKLRLLMTIYQIYYDSKLLYWVVTVPYTEQYPHTLCLYDWDLWHKDLPIQNQWE